MHMRGEPGNMQTIPPSADVLADIEAWAQEAAARAQGSGVSNDRIVLDPGIGFGKTAAQNMQILRHLNRLAAAGFPILVGTSRKSFIGSILKKPAHELVSGLGHPWLRPLSMERTLFACMTSQRYGKSRM